MLPFNTISYAMQAALEVKGEGVPARKEQQQEGLKPVTNKELATILRGRIKCYVGVMRKSRHFLTLRRIEDGHAGRKAIKRFARAYGFTGTLDAWFAPPELR